jgi:integrase
MCQRLMLRCGLRVSEVSNVRWEVIDTTQGTLRVHNRKGPADRMVSLSPDGATALRQWHGLRSASIGKSNGLGISYLLGRIADKLTMPGHGSTGLFSPHFYPPFVKGGGGDFGAATAGKSPLTPLCQRGVWTRPTEN